MLVLSSKSHIPIDLLYRLPFERLEKAFLAQMDPKSRSRFRGKSWATNHCVPLIPSLGFHGVV